MSIAEIEEYPNVIVLKVYGSLTAKVINEFDDICDLQLKKNPEAIALDCSMIDFIDSVGINHLFKLSNTSLTNSIKLVMFNLNPTIKQIFQVTNLDRLLTIVSKEAFESEYMD